MLRAPDSYAPLSQWVEKNEEFLWSPMKDFSAVVAEQAAKSTPLLGWLRAVVTLELAAVLAVGRGVLKAVSGDGSFADELVFFGLARHLGMYIRKHVRDNVDDRTARKMKGKMTAEHFAHALNMCILLGLTDEAKWLAGGAAEFVETRHLELRLQDYATYTIFFGRRYFGMGEMDWPNEVERPAHYEAVLEQWPDVSPEAIHALLKHHELGLNDPEIFSPGWEWACEPMNVFPLEVLALGRMLPSVQTQLKEISHPMLDRLPTIETVNEDGPLAKIVRQIRRDFDAFLEV